MALEDKVEESEAILCCSGKGKHHTGLCGSKDSLQEIWTNPFALVSTSKAVSELWFKKDVLLEWRPEESNIGERGLDEHGHVWTVVAWSREEKEEREYCNIKGWCKDEKNNPFSLSAVVRARSPRLKLCKNNSSQPSGKTFLPVWITKIKHKLVGEPLQYLLLEVV